MNNSAVYQGYAFTENEKEKQKEISDRYKELDLSTDDIEIEKTPAYKKGEFRGRLLSEKANSLSAMDVLIFADQGNLCFGGTCSINPDGTFRGHYWTD